MMFAFLILLSLSGCSKPENLEETSSISIQNEQANNNSQNASENSLSSAQESAITSEIINSQTSSENEEFTEIEAIGDINVEKDLFDVILTIPAEFAESDKTQADYDALAKEKDYKSITLNEDGSLTYIMTKSQHKELMLEMAEMLRSTLNDMCGSEEYPNFISILVNDNFTKFEIIIKNEELDLVETFSVLSFYFISGTYNTFNGTQNENCNVVFLNEATGKIVDQFNSDNMAD